MSHPINQPAHGNLLHPRADQRDTLATKKEAIVSGIESSEDQPEPFWINKAGFI